MLLHSLHFVSSFNALHLDGIPLTESMAKRLAKLVARNDCVQSVALRNCLLSAVSWQTFSAVAHDEISRSDRKQRVLEHLTMSHNELRRHSLSAPSKKRYLHGECGVPLHFKLDDSSLNVPILSLTAIEDGNGFGRRLDWIRGFLCQ